MSIREEYGFTNAPASKRSEGARVLPHTVLGEQGVLACILQEPAKCLPKVREHFGGEQALYDLRHQVIFKAMCDRWDKVGALDVLLLVEELTDAGQLEQVGGYAYVSALPDQSPSAQNLEHYLEGVWEKHLARRLVENASRVVGSVLEINGVNETLIGQLTTLHEDFIRKTQRGAVTPQHLRSVDSFAEETFAHFFGAHAKEAPGFELPFGFPLKIRKREATLLFGDDGSGKSTVLSFILVHLLKHPGEKAVVASFEMPPPVTLWIMAAQLLGRKSMPPNNDNALKMLGTAIAWLNARVLFYDFMGIASWQEVRDTFRFAAERQGATLFTIDNAMRMGIADDDYAGQALAAATFHQFAEDHNGHVFIVLHENKGDGKGKAKIRGSKLWSANFNNVLRVGRNTEKQEKIDKEEFSLRVEREQSKPDQGAIMECERAIGRLQKEWDTEVVLHKQRYPGTRQNGSKRIWFDPNCFQFRDEPNATAVNWLERWRR
jgi:energy-coupling factor transporter ATP-binding protein EcfA2